MKSSLSGSEITVESPPFAESGTEKSKENSVVPPPEISLVDTLALVTLTSTRDPLEAVTLDSDSILSSWSSSDFVGARGCSSVLVVALVDS